MNGHVIPSTPIAVDFWKLRSCPTARLFFLSHMHADHTAGLTSSWAQPIYCSPITKKLLIQKFQIKEWLIKELAVNESHIVLMDGDGQETVTVSLIDANHCPGSVMFIFQGYFGTILYTGDFRYTDHMFLDTPLSKLRELDELYLDNTYCDPQCDFPSRMDAKLEMFEIISRHPSHQILIGVHNLGKEDLLASLAIKFQTWIVVSPKYYKTLECLEVPNVFTTDDSEGRIHAVPIMQVTKKTLEHWNSTQPTLAILPSALYTGLNGTPYCNQPNIHVVPYSDHSSYTELHQFVSRVQPKLIIPVVRGSTKGVFGTDISGRSDMSCFDSYLNDSPRQSIEIPDSVKRYMLTHPSNLNGQSGKSRSKMAKAHQILKSKTKRAYPPRNPKGVLFETPPKASPVTAEAEHMSPAVSRGQHFNKQNNPAVLKRLPHTSHNRPETSDNFSKPLVADDSACKENSNSAILITGPMNSIDNPNKQNHPAFLKQLPHTSHNSSESLENFSKPIVADDSACKEDINNPAILITGPMNSTELFCDVVIIDSDDEIIPGNDSDCSEDLLVLGNPPFNNTNKADHSSKPLNHGALNNVELGNKHPDKDSSNHPTPAVNSTIVSDDSAYKENSDNSAILITGPMNSTDNPGTELVCDIVVIDSDDEIIPSTDSDCSDLLARGNPPFNNIHKADHSCKPLNHGALNNVELANKHPDKDSSNHPGSALTKCQQLPINHYFRAAEPFQKDVPPRYSTTSNGLPTPTLNSTNAVSSVKQVSLKEWVSPVQSGNECMAHGNKSALKPDASLVRPTASHKTVTEVQIENTSPQTSQKALVAVNSAKDSSQAQNEMTCRMPDVIDRTSTEKRLSEKVVKNMLNSVIPLQNRKSKTQKRQHFYSILKRYL